MQLIPASRPGFCIMDGWGQREETTANAVRLALTPNVDRLWSSVGMV